MYAKSEDAEYVALAWAHWCGENKWTQAARRFAELGGRIHWWCGYPRSASAIPLTFALYGPDGQELPSNSRLRDLHNAIASLTA